MIMHFTHTLEPYTEASEKTLLYQMGMADWRLSCVSVFNKIDSETFSAKYYFYKEVPNW